jgi:AcrR family transcriptional regulator
MAHTKAAVKPRRKSTRDKNLSRPEVLTAALHLIEEHGVAELSMRKLASAVHVEGVMSLYNHVANKNDVLDGVTGLFFDRLELPEPTDDWAHDLRALSDALRALARAYPQTATLALTREAVSDSGIATTAAALTILRRAGFDIDEAVQALRMTTAFLIGFLRSHRWTSTANTTTACSSCSPRSRTPYQAADAPVRTLAEPLSRRAPIDATPARPRGARHRP